MAEEEQSIVETRLELRDYKLCVKPKGIYVSAMGFLLQLK